MSKHHYHAVIWIDHREARVFHFSPTDVERLILHPDQPTKHIHHKANSIGSGHASVGDQAMARRILGLPEDREAAILVALGYPAGRSLKPIRGPKRRAFDDVVHRERW